MKTLTKELWEFAKRPNEQEYENYSLKSKLLLMAKILFLDFGFVIILFPLMYIIQSKTNLYSHYDDELLLLPKIILYSIFLFPIFEELLLRLPLKFKYNPIALGLNIITKGKFKLFWENNYKYIFYSFVLLFGILHLTKNIDFSLTFILLSPILIISQIFGGFLLSFLRIRVGLIWSIVSHIVFNFTIIILGIMFAHNSTLLDMSTNKVDTFRINSILYGQYDDKNFDPLIVNDTIFHFVAEQYKMKNILDSLGIKDVSLLKTGFVNAEFRSDIGLTRDEVKEILIKKEIIEDSK